MVISIIVFEINLDNINFVILVYIQLYNVYILFIN